MKYVLIVLINPYTYISGQLQLSVIGVPYQQGFSFFFSRYHQDSKYYFPEVSPSLNQFESSFNTYMYFRHLFFFFRHSGCGQNERDRQTLQKKNWNSLAFDSKMDTHSRTRKPSVSSQRKWPKCTTEVKDWRLFRNHL